MKEKIQIMLYIIVLIMPIVIVVGSIALTIYCYVVYGNKPLTEVPVWALWFMRGR